MTDGISSQKIVNTGIVKELTKKDLEIIHGIMESVIDMFSPDQIKDYDSVVLTFKKVEDILVKGS